MLGVSASGFYEWRSRKQSQRQVADEQLTAMIAQIHERSRGSYGSPRVHAELRLGQNIRCGRKRVERLMRHAGLQGIYRRRRKGCTVWDADQCGQFLDAIGQHRLCALYHVAAYWGLRRSELIGLAWSDVDLTTRRIHVRQAQVSDVLDSTKSEDSERIIVIDHGTADVLRAWRAAQLAERLAWGPTWNDTGRVFTREDGTPVRPGWVSERFGTLAAKAGLPPVTFHGLRHGTATMLLAAGQPPKVISEVLGHSTVSFTMTVYTEVAESLAESAASAIVPRSGRMSQQ